ncbi:MAG: type VI secretion system protein TssL, partial [Mesorhizobium sp.]
GAAVLATAIYLGLSMGLSSQAVELSTLVRALPPPTRGEISRKSPPVDAPLPEAVDFALVPEFQAGAPANLRAALSGTESVSLARL